MLTHRFEYVLDRYVFSVQTTWKDRPPVKKDGRNIEADHRHHHAGKGFVTASKTYDCIVTMATHGQFNGISNGLS